MSEDFQVGDIVAVRAAVKRVQPGVGMIVELFSKTDQYEAWIREDLVVDRLVAAEDADEPPVGSYVEATSALSGTPLVYRRVREEDGWSLVNTNGIGQPWREVKADAKSWRLLWDGSHS